ncbi:MAG: patatin-like phospholipase family protein [Cyclobacteriaceae bacterium]
MNLSMNLNQNLISLLTAIAFLILNEAPAQNNSPKIGLVLSGGGAKGMAHIGVIQAMEKAGIYPDVITGTSAGSIVGGLYALGYSGDELEEISLKIDWDKMITNEVPFNEIAFEEKAYYGRYVAELPTRGLVPELPNGLIEGQNWQALLSTLTRSAHGIEHFDDLPIPFRCMATDISTGERVTIESGPLAEAIRASMAIPSVFTAVEIDDRLLVDGGLVRNFPVQDAIDMGADIIVGVFVSSDLEPKENLNSMVDVLIQSTFVLSAYDSREQIALTDLFIDPDMSGYATLDFNETEGIISRGKKKGEEWLPRFEMLADSLKALGKVFRAPEKLESSDSYFINNIVLEGNKEVPRDLILSKLDIAEDEEINIDRINKKIKAVYGTRYFSKINYEIIKEDSTSTLLIRVKERPKVHLKAAVHYNNEVDAGLNLNITARNIIGNNSRFITEIDFSKNFRGDVNYLKYLGSRQNMAITLGYSLLDAELPVFQDASQIATFKDTRNNFSLTIQSTKKAHKSVGIRIENYFNRFKPSISDQFRFIEKGKEQSTSVTGFWSLNTLNKAVLPTSGMVLSVEPGYIFHNDLSLTLSDSVGAESSAEQLLEANQFFKTDLSFAYFIPMSKKFTFIAKVQSRYSSVSKVGLNREFGIGGFYTNYPFTVPFWGVAFDEFRSSSYAMASAALQVEPVKDYFITAQLNYIDNRYPAKFFHSSRTFSGFGGNPGLLGGGIGVGYRSILGPILINVGRASHSKRWKGGVSIGFSY